MLVRKSLSGGGPVCRSWRSRMPTNPPIEPAQLEAECQRLTEALALAERDRQLLGYEIHDGVVQDLTAAAMLLEGAGRQAQVRLRRRAKKASPAACGCCKTASPQPAG